MACELCGARFASGLEGIVRIDLGRSGDVVDEHNFNLTGARQLRLGAKPSRHLARGARRDEEADLCIDARAPSIGSHAHTEVRAPQGGSY